MEAKLTKAEKIRLWSARIVGIFACGLLVAFLVLYYIGKIDSSMFTIAMLGLSGVVLFVASSFLAIKSTQFWMSFCFVLAILFIIAFVTVLIVFSVNGTIQM